MRAIEVSMIRGRNRRRNAEGVYRRDLTDAVNGSGQGVRAGPIERGGLSALYRGGSGRHAAGSWRTAARAGA